MDLGFHFDQNRSVIISDVRCVLEYSSLWKSHHPPAILAINHSYEHAVHVQILLCSCNYIILIRQEESVIRRYIMYLLFFIVLMIRPSIPCVRPFNRASLFINFH